jgi:hypothetical protein
VCYLSRIKTRLGITGELLQFFWDLKLWKMISVIVIVLFFELVIVFTHGTAAAPFVYTPF